MSGAASREVAGVGSVAARKVLGSGGRDPVGGDGGRRFRRRRRRFVREESRRREKKRKGANGSYLLLEPRSGY